VDEVSCCVFVMDMRQVESQSGWQKRLSVVGLGVAEFFALTGSRGIHQTS